VNARTAYKVSVTKGAPGPALFAVPGRIDRVEVVELGSGETVLLWEGEPMEASRLTRALRRDLAKFTADQFREAWLTEATIASGNV
jgi:hypothetical protein